MMSNFLFILTVVNKVGAFTSIVQIRLHNTTAHNVRANLVEPIYHSLWHKLFLSEILAYTVMPSHSDTIWKLFCLVPEILQSLKHHKVKYEPSVIEQKIKKLK